MTIALCITCYNKDYYLTKFLMSYLKQQTVAPNEIIIYCSGIKYTETLEFIIINNKKIDIQTIFSSKLTNQAVARNICSKIANSSYIMFCDVDDIPHPSKIDIIQNIINKYTPDFILHNYNNIFNYNIIKFEQINNIILLPINEIDKNSTNVICRDYPIHHAHITVKKSIFNTIQFNETDEYYRKEDGKFCQDLVMNNYKGIYCTSKLVNYMNKI